MPLVIPLNKRQALDKAMKAFKNLSPEKKQMVLDGKMVYNPRTSRFISLSIPKHRRLKAELDIVKSSDGALINQAVMELIHSEGQVAPPTTQSVALPSTQPGRRLNMPTGGRYEFSGSGTQSTTEIPTTPSGTTSRTIDLPTPIPIPNPEPTKRGKGVAPSGYLVVPKNASVETLTAPPFNLSPTHASKIVRARQSDVVGAEDQFYTLPNSNDLHDTLVIPSTGDPFSVLSSPTPIEGSDISVPEFSKGRYSGEPLAQEVVPPPAVPPTVIPKSDIPAEPVAPATSKPVVSPPEEQLSIPQIAGLEVIPPQQRVKTRTQPEITKTNTTDNPLNTQQDESYGVDEVDTKEGQVKNKMMKLARSGRLNKMNIAMGQTLNLMSSSYDFKPKNRPPTDYKGLLKDYKKLQADYVRLMGKMGNEGQSAPMPQPKSLGVVISASSLPANTIPSNTPMINQAGVRTLPMPSQQPQEVIEQQVSTQKQQTDYKRIINPSNSFKINIHKKDTQPKKLSAGGLPFVLHTSTYRQLN